MKMFLRTCFLFLVTAFAATTVMAQTNDTSNSSSSSSTLYICCQFMGMDNDDCVVFGQLGDRVLIPWPFASQDCLDHYQIKDQAIDPTTLSSIFPNPDGSNADVNGFVNFLKFNRGLSVVESMLTSLGDYFEADSAGQMQFKDSIVVDGTTYDCTSTTTDCWNALKVYFGETSDGMAVLQDQGQLFYNAQRLSREKEQSFVRIRLCSEPDSTADSLCGALAVEVASRVATGANNCSAFGLGPATTDLPCENGVPGTSDVGATTDTTTRDIDMGDETATTTDGTSTTGGGSSITTMSAAAAGSTMMAGPLVVFTKYILLALVTSTIASSTSWF